MKKLFSVLCLFSLCVSTAAAAGDLAPGILSGSLFSQEYRTIPEFANERAAWVVQKESLRFPKPSFTLGPVQPGETICSLKDENLRGLRISLYNRGDDGKIPEPEFVEKLSSCVKSLDSVFQTRSSRHDRKSDPTKTTYEIGGFLWKLPHASALLEYSVATHGTVTRPVPEYIRLTILPAAEAAAQTAAPVRRRVNPAQHVSRSAGGVSEIMPFPMVDQGQKGYCAAATTARIMAYFGYDFLDQHQIAQWAKTEPDAGTSNEAMMRGIRRVLHDSYRFNVLELEKMDVEELLKIVKRYNDAAKKTGTLPISLPRSGTISINQIFASFDRETLIKSRAGAAVRNEVWLTRMKTYLDKGIPVLWSVQLGIVLEPEIPQAAGGHMRIITGYGGMTPNDRYIIYTDSWGAGHERKTMPLADAISITTGLKVIFPTRN